MFAPRQRESDAKAFFDTEGLMRKACTRDWERMMTKDKFASALQRWGSRCALTPPDPQLKGAQYPGGFNP